jgi:hypothetical protein
LKPFTGLVGITVPTDSGKKDITREDNKEKR